MMSIGELPRVFFTQLLKSFFFGGGGTPSVDKIKITNTHTQMCIVSIKAQ